MSAASKSARGARRPAARAAFVRGTLMRNPVILATVYIALVIVSSISFRQRDPLASVNGSVDAQVAMEIGAWCVVAGWLGMRALRERERFPLNRPRTLGPALIAYVPFITMIGLSTIYGHVGVLSIFRAFQYVVLFTMTAWTYRALAPDPARFSRFWVVVRRQWWALSVVATLATFAIPIWEPFLEGYYRDMRFRWFAGHPVGTASMLGLAIVMLVGSALGHRDWRLRTRRGRFVFVFLLVFLLAALFATKSRGSMAATAAGIGVLALLSPDRRMRGWIGLGSMGLVVFMATGSLVTFINDVILRNQSSEQLLSLTGRVGLFDAALPLVAQKLWFGHGYLSARSAFLSLAWGAGETHNLFLEAVFSTGLVGLACLFWFCSRFIALHREAQRMGRHGMAGITREAAALFAFLMVVGIVEDTFAGAPGSHAVVLMFAILAVDVQLGSVLMRRRRRTPIAVPHSAATRRTAPADGLSRA